MSDTVKTYWEVVKVKYSEDKKREIRAYILEKVSQKVPSISKTVAETFSVNASTVHVYINELIEEQVIRKVKRGEYEFITNEYTYELSREKGDLDSDTYAYEACLREHIEQYDKNVKDIWSYVFSEMINNVMDHSLAENVRIIIEQDYVKTSVFVFDNGVGIFHKIQEHFKLPSIEEAICELFKGKLTTDAANHSGKGIFFSSKLMDNFLIASDGKIFTNNKYDDSRIIDMALDNSQGTCVFMELSNFTHKETREVFDAYANDDGSFVKTNIPLKNIFDASPVSRSQAKRVCNRLDRFQEVIVDFEDVTWMGQGFAHQLFVVFANSHKDIVITPVNMNEDITRMYNHVRNSDDN